MADKNTKKKYLIEEIKESEEIEENGEKSEEISDKNKKEEWEIEKNEKKNEKELLKKEEDKKKKRIENEVLKVLKTGKMNSKLNLTKFLISTGINYSLRINLISNSVNPEIPELGGVLKKLRWQNKINFSMEKGNHVHFIKNDKIIKVKPFKIDFDWRKYKIPNGENELYLVYKIPKKVNPGHFLSSCNPIAKFNGFKLKINKKYEKEPKFVIFNDKLDGYFDDGKLVLRCKTSETNIDKTLYTINQIGRKILEEMLQMGRVYSEILKINEKTMFIPVIPIFRARVKQSFYKSKFNSVFKFIYDFPNKFEKKNVFGNFSILSKEIHDEQFNLNEFYDVIEQYFIFQTKSFISSAITKDWIINPAKALNYIESDAELEALITEYIQDIDTERIIQDRLEEKMERNEFIKETMSNLMLTLLGLSFLADDNLLKILMVFIFIGVNIWTFYVRRKKMKEKKI